MKLINPTVEIWEPASDDFEAMLKHIERCGRVCYKSENKISEDSYEKFISNLILNGHTSVLEHGTVYLTIPLGDPDKDADFYYKLELVNFFKYNAYSEVKEIASNKTEDYPEEVKNFLENKKYALICYITTNYRVLIQNPYIIEQSKQYISSCTSNHEKRITVHWTIDRGISHEFVRHRVFSFSQESTRYCNYSKDKFGNELTFIKPTWFDESPAQQEFISCLENIEKTYFNLLNNGCKAQEARQILPNALKTELLMTGTQRQWLDFFTLRDNNKAHPDARQIVHQLRELL